MNEQTALKGQTFVVGLNHMSDWTDEEYNNMLGLIPDGQLPESIIEYDHMNSNQRNGKYPDRPTRDDSSPIRLLQERRSLQQASKSSIGDLIAEKIQKATGFNISDIKMPTKLGEETNWAEARSPAFVTPVKDQGRNCSASYAFAVVAALEASQAKETGQSAISLSE